MFAKQANARRDWYADLWERRQALQEALVTRLPALALPLCPPASRLRPIEPPPTDEDAAQ